MGKNLGQRAFQSLPGRHGLPVRLIAFSTRMRHESPELRHLLTRELRYLLTRELRYLLTGVVALVLVGCSENSAKPQFYLFGPKALTTQQNQFVFTRTQTIAPIVPSGPGSIQQYTYSIDTKSGNPLPAGLAIDPHTGVISGTPTQEIGPITVVLAITNPGGKTSTSLQMQVVAVPPGSLDLSSALGTVDTPQGSGQLAGTAGDNVPALQPQVSGGDILSTSTYYKAPTYHLIGALQPRASVGTSLPADLSAQSSLGVSADPMAGSFSGTLAQSCGGGTSAVCQQSMQLCIQNSGGFACSAPFQVIVNPQLALTATQGLSNSGVLAIGDSFTAQIAGGVAPFQWAVPSVLNGSPQSGSLTAVFQAASSGAFQLVVSDASRLIAHTATLSGQVAGSLQAKLTYSDLENGDQTTVQYSNGVGNVTCSLDNQSSAPVSLNGCTATATADPTGAPVTAVVHARDSAYVTHDVPLTITVHPRMSMTPLAVTWTLMDGDQLTAVLSGGIGPYQWGLAQLGSATITPSADGLSAVLNVTGAGNLNGTLTITDSSPRPSAHHLQQSIIVNPSLTFSASNLLLETGQSLTLSSSGGVGAVQLQISGTNPPLSVPDPTHQPMTVLAGTPVPTPPNVYQAVTVSATDGATLTGAHVSKSITLQIYPQLSVKPSQIVLSVGDQLSLIPSGGIAPYLFSLTQGPQSLTAAGLYTPNAPSGNQPALISLTDSAPIIASPAKSQVTVTQPLAFALSPPAVPAADGSLSVGPNVLVTGTLSGGVTPYQIGQDSTLSGATISQSPSGFQFTSPAVDGDYNLVLTDSLDPSLSINSARHTLPLTVHVFQPVALTSITINGGNQTVTSVPFLQVTAQVVANNNHQIQVQLVEATSGTCPVAPNASGPWQTWIDSTTPYSITVSSLDGTKTICGYAKSEHGSMSTPFAQATIKYIAQYPPLITAIQLTPEVGPTPRLVKSGDSIHVHVTAAIDSRVDPSLNITLGNTQTPSIVGEISVGGGLNQWSPLPSNCQANPATGGTTATLDCVISAPISNAADGSGFIQIRATAHDVAGNSSPRDTSDTLNTANWSIYAGSVDDGIGLGRKAVNLKHSATGTGFRFGVDPVNNDTYAISEGVGIIHLNASTGLTNVFLTDTGKGNVTTNLPAPGTAGFQPLPDQPKASLFQGSMRLNGAGHLFFTHNLLTDQSSFISYALYEINLHPSGGGAPQVRWVVGGLSTSNAQSNATDPILPTGRPENATLVTQAGVAGPEFSIDEDGSIYFLSQCNPSVLATPYDLTDVKYLSRFQLMKLTQPTDGSAPVVSWIVGKCDASPFTNAPTEGADPKAIPLTAQRWVSLTPFDVKNHGRVVVWTYDAQTVFSVVDGVVHAFAPANPLKSGIYPNLYFDRSTGAASGQLLVAQLSQIARYSYATDLPATPTTGYVPASPKEISLLGNPSGATGQCSNDFIAADTTHPCLVPSGGFAQAADGTILFMDGFEVNSGQNYRIRYVTSDGSLQTLLGRGVFVGDTLDRSAMIGNPGGVISVQKPLANRALGVYLIDRGASIISRIDPTTQQLSIIAGNGSANGNVTTGESITTGLSLGTPYQWGRFAAFAMDSVGDFWFAPYTNLTVWNAANGQASVYMDGSNVAVPKNWSDPTLTAINAGIASLDAFSSGMTLIDDHRFVMLGGYADSGQAPAILRLFDLNVNQVTTLLGDTIYTVPSPDPSAPASPDQLTPGSYSTLPLNGKICGGSGNWNCATLAATTIESGVKYENVFFSEGKALRKIRSNLATGALGTGSDQLVTVFTDSVNLVTNFTSSVDAHFNSNFARIFYGAIDGNLYCWDLDPPLIAAHVNQTSTDLCGYNDVSGNSIRGSALFPFAGNTPISPPGGSVKPNSMAWLTPTQLLISNGGGQVIQFTVPW